MKNIFLVGTTMNLSEVAVLLETPMRIDDLTDLAFDNYETNRDRYDLFVKYKSKKFLYSINGIEIYTLKLGSEDVIVGLNHSTKQVAYYCNFEVKVEKDVGRSCTQIMVWSDRKPKTKDLPRTIFFNYLLKKYKTMQSDTMHTLRGEKFWKSNIKLAFEVGFNVYFYNAVRHKLTQLPSYSNFVALADSDLLWGNEFSHADITLIISHKDLKTT